MVARDDGDDKSCIVVQSSRCVIVCKWVKSVSVCVCVCVDKLWWVLDLVCACVCARGGRRRSLAVEVVVLVSVGAQVLFPSLPGAPSLTDETWRMNLGAAPSPSPSQAVTVIYHEQDIVLTLTTTTTTPASHAITIHPSVIILHQRLLDNNDTAQRTTHTASTNDYYHHTTHYFVRTSSFTGISKYCTGACTAAWSLRCCTGPSPRRQLTSAISKVKNSQPPTNGCHLRTRPE